MDEKLGGIFLKSMVYLLPSALQDNAETEEDNETLVPQQPVSSSSSSSPSAAAAAAAAVDIEEQVDIDLADPEVQKAAVFIQSSFKGFKQRKSSQGLSKVDCPDLLN